MAYYCKIAAATKWHHVSLFLESKKKNLIRLHSPKIVYTHLVTRLRLSTFVCDSSTFVYTRDINKDIRCN